MVVDTSALFAILFDEPERSAFFLKIATTAAVIPATVVVELGIQIDKLPSSERRQAVRESFEKLGLPVISIDEGVARLARDAHTVYGRYSKHPARLNFGDCFSYALAKSRNDSLLFKGQDFSETDVIAA